VKVERNPELIEETLRSESLYGGEFRAVEMREARPKKRWGGQQIKDRLQPVLYWFLRNAPRPLALSPFYLITGMARLAYPIRRNPLKRSCEDLCRIATAAGVSHEPRVVHAHFLQNVLAAARSYRDLLRGGSDEVLGRVDTSDLQRSVGKLVKAGRPFILFVPHNLAAIYGGVALTRMLPLLIVARNSKTIRRTRLALDVYERINAKVLMVRGSNPFEIARAMYSALADGKVLVATVDNVDPASGTPAAIFGVDVEFAPWAAKIAAKRSVPVVPMYFHSDGDNVRVVCGEPLVTNDTVTAIRHYVSFFEQRILQDPASWAYLADRKWSRIMRRAAGAAN